MLISIKNKYIFISNPKTGSRSVRDFLRENDDSVYWNSFSYKGKSYFITEHARARDIKSKLGEYYDDFYVFTFIRDPYKKAVSGYFFYKNGIIIKKRKIKSFKFKVLAILNIILAKILPFKIWVLLKPLKTNFEFVSDKNGQVIVDYVGLTENIPKDMDNIFKQLKLPFKGDDIGRINVSAYKRQVDHFEKIKKYFDLKYKKDIELYNRFKKD